MSNFYLQSKNQIACTYAAQFQFIWFGFLQSRALAHIAGITSAVVSLEMIWCETARLHSGVNKKIKIKKNCFDNGLHLGLV